MGLVTIAILSAIGSANADELEQQQIRDLTAKLNALTARMALLEKSTETAQAAAATATEKLSEFDKSTQRTAELEANVAQLSQSMASRGDDTGLPIHGFIQVGAGFQSKISSSGFPQSGGDSDRLRNFNGGALDFYLNPKLGDHVRSLVELNFEYDRAGSVGVDLERAQLGYATSGNAVFWAGRFHTPYGYWNTAFHHGAEIQTSLTRPNFINFEDSGGIMPAHSVGLWYTDKSQLSSGKLSYDLYVANGKKIMAGDNTDKSLDFNAFTDPKGKLATGFNVGYTVPSGWKFGIDGFMDSVTAYAGTGSDYSKVLSESDFRMLGAYTVYDGDDWELIGEYYDFRNTTQVNAVAGLGTLGDHNSSAWFVQGAYNLDASYTPYLRFEKSALSGNDVLFNTFNSGRSYDKVVLGLRYNIDSKSALKFELSETSDKSGSELNTTGAAPAIDSFGATNFCRIQMQYATSF